MTRPPSVMASTTASPSQLPSFQDQQAPANDGGAPLTMPYTCLECSRRKVKCSKTGPPCTTCSKMRVECVYEAPAPRKRKRKAEDNAQTKLREYESLLKSNGLLPSKGALPTPHVTPPAAALSQQHTPVSIAQNGGAVYSNSSLWRTLDGDPYGSAHDDESDDQPDTRDPGVATSALSTTIDPVTASFWGTSSMSKNLYMDHPSYDNAMKLWSAYSYNVEPICRVTHGPSTSKMVQRVAAGPSAASPAELCLVFAIYHFAVASMTDDQCKSAFGLAREVLKRQYHDSLRQALVNAHFLRTTDFTVIQAFVLLLLTVRDTYDANDYWILTGVAIRLVQRLGMHTDSEPEGLSPYDVQMRRRVWWQILPLDVLAAQLCGTGVAVSPDSWNAKLALNINDDDIWPGMTETPVERAGATDMIFCLARSELHRFHQKVKPATGLTIWSGRITDDETINSIDDALVELEDKLETKYVRYCDVVIPIHWCTMMLARGAITSIRLRVRLPRAKAQQHVPDHERKLLYDLTIKSMHYSISSFNNDAIRPYRWHLHAMFQWDPLIWVLEELRCGSPFVDINDAWSKIEQLLLSQPAILTLKRPLDGAVGELILKAWTATPNTGREPDFIAALKDTFGKRAATKQPPVASLSIPAAQQTQTMSYPDALDFSSTMDGMDFGFDSDQIDWEFWDQMLKDPAALSL